MISKGWIIHIVMGVFSARVQFHNRLKFSEGSTSKNDELLDHLQYINIDKTYQQKDGIAAIYVSRHRVREKIPQNHQPGDKTSKIRSSQRAVHEELERFAPRDQILSCEDRSRILQQFKITKIIT